VPPNELTTWTEFLRTIVQLVAVQVVEGLSPCSSDRQGQRRQGLSAKLK